MLLEGKRLNISEFTLDMAYAVHRNSLDEDTRRFLPDEVFETEEEARETVSFLMEQYGKAEGPLAYPVLLKTGENIGYVEIVPLGNGEWEAGYHIAKPYTGQGYATEALRLFLPWAMGALSLQRVLGICCRENAASARVMEKCGFQLFYDGPGFYQGKTIPIRKYSLEILKSETPATE